MRQIQIKKVMNGFIVEVGCQTLVFQSREELLVQLGRYLLHPEQVEKEFTEKYGMGGAPTPVRDQCVTESPRPLDPGYAGICEQAQPTAARDYANPGLNRY